MNANTIPVGTGLDEKIWEWLRETAGGVVTEVRAIAGGGQRKTFFVSVSGGASIGEQVLQVRTPTSGSPYDGKGITSLAREAALFRVLHGTDAAWLSPGLIGVNPDATAILTERAPGVSDFDGMQDSRRRQAITEEFIAALVSLHSVDARVAAPVDFEAVEGPTGAATAWLGVWDRLFNHVHRPSPLVRFALRWLRDHAPQTSGAPVICHGDLGPGNFLFEGDRVTKFVDWELAHLGDFHNDLGMLALRGFQLGSMNDLDKMLGLYSRLSGRPVDGWKIRYYRAMSLILGAVTSLVQLDDAIATSRPMIAMPLYLHLVPLLQLWLAEALLDLSGLSPQPIGALPETDVDMELLDVALALDGATASLAALGSSGGQAGYADLVKHLDAKARYGKLIEAADLDDLVTFLGERPSDVWSGRAALDQRVVKGDVDDESFLQWSWRSAKRQSLLWPAWAARYERSLLPIT